MFTVIDDRARKLDEWLGEKEREITERYHFDEDADVAALEAVNVPRQEKICCIGRICNSVRDFRIFDPTWMPLKRCSLSIFACIRPTRDASTPLQCCWKVLETRLVDSASK